ncbi:MFS transporter [Bifidobacterium callitrichidarum]|uniref:MFS transporter n=1 Tax=Bifidobacterium callitrichidarum TaxID=2052941 RepID=A0A2U2N5S2_9BIFI|nr:MFS transporter [Bifidobacterium callitrichidarum]
MSTTRTATQSHQSDQPSPTAEPQANGAQNTQLAQAVQSTQTDRTTQAAHHSPYQRLFTLPGTKAFCLSGAVARLPISMMSLGIVLALNHIYDNWTVAGTMSAVYVLAMSCVTPFYARAFDRFGQARVGRIALAVQLVAMLSFAFAALVRVPIPVLFGLAIIMGLTQFSFGALVRTRWAYALRGVEDGEQLLNTAYAMEAAIDEIVFILGPILAAWLATSVHPVSQLFVPTLACGIGGTVFLSLKSTQPPVMIEQVEVRAASGESQAGTGQATADSGNTSGEADQLTLRQLKRSGAKPKSVLLYGGVLPLLVVFIVFNMSFTSFDVSITATMKGMGLEPFLGLQLAMFAVGSCVGALIFGSRQLKGSHWGHMVMFLALLTVGYLFFRVTMDNLILLGLIEILTGLTVSPLFATGNLIVKDLVPPESLTEGLSWVTTAGTVGTSIGSSVAGIVLDAANPHVGMLLPFAFTLAAVPLALLGWRLSKRR